MPVGSFCSSVLLFFLLRRWGSCSTSLFGCWLRAARSVVYPASLLPYLYYAVRSATGGPLPATVVFPHAFVCVPKHTAFAACPHYILPILFYALPGFILYAATPPAPAISLLHPAGRVGTSPGGKTSLRRWATGSFWRLTRGLPGTDCCYCGSTPTTRVGAWRMACMVDVGAQHISSRLLPLVVLRSGVLPCVVRAAGWVMIYCYLCGLRTPVCSGGFLCLLYVPLCPTYPPSVSVSCALLHSPCYPSHNGCWTVVLPSRLHAFSLATGGCASPVQYSSLPCVRAFFACRGC